MNRIEEIRREVLPVVNPVQNAGDLNQEQRFRRRRQRRNATSAAEILVAVDLYNTQSINTEERSNSCLNTQVGR